MVVARSSQPKLLSKSPPNQYVRPDACAYRGGGGKQDDAMAIARLIVPRLDHPLDYDGAKAAAALPAPKAHPASACDVVPRSAVEGAIGRLDGAPTADSDGSKCSYRLASAQGPRSYQIEYV